VYEKGSGKWLFSYKIKVYNIPVTINLNFNTTPKRYLLQCYRRDRPTLPAEPEHTFCIRVDYLHENMDK
jgi:hypothetical protein